MARSFLQVFAFVEVMNPGIHPDYPSLIQKIVAVWLEIRSLDGAGPKPHWAKTFQGWLPNIAEIVTTAFADQIAAALPILKAYNGKGPGSSNGSIFQNEFMSSLFPLGG